MQYWSAVSALLSNNIRHQDEALDIDDGAWPEHMEVELPPA